MDTTKIQRDAIFKITPYTRTIIRMSSSNDELIFLD